MEPAQAILLVALAWSLPRAEQAALLEACSRAFASGVCVLEGEGVTESAAELAAEVRPGTAERVSLDVRAQGALGNSVTRELAFGVEDSALERAKAVGLTLGVLGGELLRQEREAASRREAVDDGRAKASGALAPAAASSERSKEVPLFWSVQAGVGGQQGLDAPQWGVGSRFGLGPGFGRWGTGRPWLGLAGDAWTSNPEEGLRVRKLQGFAWLGWGESFARFDTWIALDVGVQVLEAQTTEPLARDAARRVVPQLRGSSSGAYWFFSQFGIVATAQVGVNLSSTRLWVGDEVVAQARPLEVTGLIGPIFRWGS